MRTAWFKILLVALVIALTAGNCDRREVETLFKDSNAWTEDIGNAQIISADDFEKQVKAGEIDLETPQLRDDRYTAAQAKIQADISFLSAIPAGEQSPDVASLLRADVDLPRMPDGNYVTEVHLNDGTTASIVTLGTPAMAALVKDGYERSSSLNNQFEAYRIGYEAAPATVQQMLPEPASLEGKTLGELLTARDLLDDALETLEDLDRSRIIDSDPFSLQAIVEPGDSSTSCERSATGIYTNFWWPLKNFQTSIKQQGMRGTCWAFAAAAALESREMVVGDRVLNLSEQFLINKVKREWGASDYNDGGGAEWTLERAIDNNFRIPLEQTWPYNPALGRPSTAFDDGIAGTAASYRGTCDPVTIGGTTFAYNWSCSETAHQSPWICAPAGDKNFCGYYRMVAPAGAEGVLADRTTVLWHNLWSTRPAHRRLKKFPLAELRNQLASGRVLIASFNIVRGFDNPDANGFVTDFSAEGNRGGHVAIIVGYIDNATLHARLPNAPNDRNGFFILKNSWGCAADGGYYYIPVDYVTRHFNDLSVLNMTAQRGQNWQREQANPAANQPATITIRTNPARVDLRVATDLAQFFRVAQPSLKSIRLTVTSDRDGSLFNGNWSTDTSALIGPSLLYTFTSTGNRTLTLVASNGTTQTRASFVVNVINTPPNISLQHSGDPYQNESYPITAQIRDPNESDAARLCANTQWSVDAPDSLSQTTGCQVAVTFGEAGTRTLRVMTRDSEGLTASVSRSFSVLPPPENPYPRISSFGMFALDSQFLDGTFIGCTDKPVAQGQTINFQNTGCRVSVTLPQRPRYSAKVTVENPDNEPLTYDWQVYVVLPDNELLINSVTGIAEPTFSPYSPGNAIEVTNNCRVTVQVNAPEAARSKKLTVWSGQCTYLSTRLN